jgi:Spy/CpxP family protein refolding chaperone
MVLLGWRRPKPAMEGMTMVHYRLAGLAAALLALAAGTGQFTADEPKGDADKRHDRLGALASKLGLSDQQKEELRKIHTDCDKEADPIEHQLWSLCHQEYQAMRQVLTEEQRNRVPELLKAMRDKELQKIGTELGLNEDQKQRIEKIREEYEKKFHDLAAEKEKGEKVHKEFRHLRHEFIGAISPVLTDEQRGRLPVLMREEHRYWHNPAVRREHLRALADKLGVSAEQKEQLQRIQSEYEPKVEKLASQLKQMHQQQHAAMEKVLTPDQRTKFQELFKNRVHREDKP